MGGIGRVIVLDRNRCVALEKQGDGSYQSGNYEMVASEDGDSVFMLTDGVNAWDIASVKINSSATNDLYIKVKGTEADIRVMSNRTDYLDRFYALRCEGRKGLVRYLSGDLDRVYAQFDNMELALPTDEKCFDTYSKNFGLAEGIRLAARKGDIDFIQRSLGLSDNELTTARIVQGFAKLVNPPTCDQHTLPAAASVTTASAAGPATVTRAAEAVPQVGDGKTSGGVSAVLKDIHVADAILDLRGRIAERADGMGRDFARPTIRGVPRVMPIRSSYTPWVTFSVAPQDVGQALNDVIKNLTAVVAASASSNGVRPADVRIVFISQRIPENLRSALDSAGSSIKMNGIEASVVHQTSPVFSVADALDKKVLTADREKLANTITVAVLPAAAGTSQKELLGYYSDFLLRQEGGLFIAGGEMSTYSFD